MRALDGEQFLVRIFFGDADKWHRQPLDRALLERLRREGFAGATVFRGVAMTGDIELGTLDSVNDEVPMVVRKRSMRRLLGFPGRSGYQVHTIISAHLNDLRRNVDWRNLFDV